ncbi:MAG: FIST N-terminal domain-containing protein [Myxococcota bacterium]
MRFACAVSQQADYEPAAVELVGGLHADLDGARPSLLCLFASPHHEDHWLSLAERMRREFPDALLFGCSARSVIGAGREIEQGPGVVASAASLPGVKLEPFHVANARLPVLAGPDDAHVLLLVDPFGADLDAWIPELDERFPEGTKLGGIASGAGQPGRNLLFLDDAVVRRGAIGVALTGDVAVDAVVAQGCRPVGLPMFVTGARENVLFELDGRSPMEVLGELFAAADPMEQRLFQGSLFLGIELDPAQRRFESGDFLIRNLLGADPESGALHVAADLAGRRVVQFHLRDARTADEDLERRLERHVARREEGAAGALVFSCLGRGRGLFGQPDHDTRAFHEALGPIPLAGFFGNGEIGPVEGRTFLHGYTSAFGIFRPKRGAPDRP